MEKKYDNIARSATGRLRNFGSMSSKKFEAVLALSESFKNDTEAYEKVMAEAKVRNLEPPKKGAKLDFDSKRAASKSRATVNKSDLRIMKAKRFDASKRKQVDKGRINPDEYVISEKLDGFRAIWDGKNFRSKNGNVFVAPKSFKDAMPKGVILDGELWMGREKFRETSKVLRREKWDSDEEHEAAWDQFTYMVFDSPSMNTEKGAKGFEDWRRQFTEKFNAKIGTGEVGSSGDSSISKEIMAGVDSKDVDGKMVFTPAMKTIKSRLALVPQIDVEEIEMHLTDRDLARVGAFVKDTSPTAYASGPFPIAGENEDWIFETDSSLTIFDNRFDASERYDRQTLIEQGVLPNRFNEMIDQVLLEMVDKDSEGFMLRRKDSAFEPTNESGSKRSNSILKVKPRFTEEALVVGYEEGLGRNEGKVGSLLMEGTYKGVKKRWKLGAGLSDEDRLNPPPKGSVVEFAWTQRTSSGLPREASFLRARPDLDPKAYSRSLRNISGQRFAELGLVNDKTYARKISDTIRARTGRNVRVIPKTRGFSVYVGPRRK